VEINTGVIYEGFDMRYGLYVLQHRKGTLSKEVKAGPNIIRKGGKGTKYNLFNQRDERRT